MRSQSALFATTLAAACMVSLTLPWASASEDDHAVPTPAPLDSEGGLAVDPSWMPLILASDPSTLPIAVLEGVPSFLLPTPDVCPPEGGSPPVGSCEDGALIVPLSGPLTVEQFAFIMSLATIPEEASDLLPLQANPPTRRCWYYDTNHYRCCYYHESGMVDCYDYWYECYSSGRYNRYCGWSAHHTYHYCGG